MTVLENVGDSPMPKHNHRFGNPQPQLGVMVEKKWQRSDFTSVPDVLKKEGIYHGRTD